MFLFIIVWYLILYFVFLVLLKGYGSNKNIIYINELIYYIIYVIYKCVGFY